MLPTKMTPQKLFLLILIAILISASLTYTFYTFYSYFEIRTIEMELKVENKLGLNTDTHKLNFGTNFPGNTNRRFITITPPRKVHLFINFKGNLSPWIEVSRNNFILEPNQSQTLAFTAHIPLNASFGLYTGQALFYFKRTF